MPPILYLANKAEDGFEGDIHADFYLKFHGIKNAIDPATDEPVEPLFISSEHGDGLTDLYQRIESLIPEAKYDEYQDRKDKRIERWKKYKDMFLDEIVKMKTEEIEEEVEEDEEY